MDDSVVTLTRRIAAFGLDGVPSPQPAAAPEATWRELFGRIQDERITGLALESVAAGWLDLTDEQTERLYTAHRDSMTWNLLVERKLIGLVDAFQEGGIAFAVLKGPSIAHTMYPEPCLRSFGDLDLLVRTADYERACALLDRMGHVRQRPEPRPGFEVRFGKGSVHIRPDDRIEVDLHRTLVLGPFGLWIDPDELLDRASTFDLAGRPIGRLNDTGMLLNVAMHASLGRSQARLVPLRDVIQVVARGRVDWSTLSAWAERWHLHAVLQDAFAEASSTLGAPVPARARSLMAGQASRGELRTLRAYKGERRSLGGTSLTTLRAIAGIGNKAAYVWDLAVPDRAFLRARANGSVDATYRHRWSIPARWAAARLPWRRTRRSSDASGSLERTSTRSARS